MTGDDFLALMPLMILAVTAVVAMLAIAIGRSHAATAGVTLIGLAAALATLPYAAELAPRHVTALLVIDGYSLFYTGLIIAATFAVTLQSVGYLDRRGRHNVEEYYILLLLAALGSAVLAASTHFVSFFLGLEVLSVSLYALIGYHRCEPADVEAAVKYLVLAGATSAFLLFGMAMVYAQTGTMELSSLAGLLTQSVGTPGVLLGAGVGMILVAVGFKLALVPFHLWTADVYQGAPAPVTGFIATASKGAMFALLLRYFTGFGTHASEAFYVIFAAIAVASMLAGNLLALLQNNVKRLLAYSSIAHLGYLMVAFMAGGELAPTAVAFYLLAYFVTTLGAFGVIAALSNGQRDAEDLSDYRGLLWRRPVLAGVLTAMLLSLAGIPLTAGFVGKFYLLAAGVQSRLWPLVLVLAGASVIGLFYYLRVIVVMARRADEPAEGEAQVAGSAESEANEGIAPLPGARPVPLTGTIVLAFLVVLLGWLGVYTAPFLALIGAMMAP